MSTHPEATTFYGVEELEPAVAEALLSWALALADTKHRLGMRISEWVNGTPALEAAVGASALTQDELGHARSYFSFLRNFPGAPDALGFENDLEARDLYYNPRLLDSPWASWLEMIAANVLLDRALSVGVAATRDSVYLPLRNRAAKILQEERFHRIFGDSWLARLAGSEQKPRLAQALQRYWPMALAWLGPDGDAVAATLYDAGVLGATPAAMRQQWRQQVEPLLQENDLAMPADEPDWSRWDAAHRDIV